MNERSLKRLRFLFVEYGLKKVLDLLKDSALE